MGNSTARNMTPKTRESMSVARLAVSRIRAAMAAAASSTLST